MRLLHQATAIKDPPTSSLKDPTIADISTAMTNWLQGIIISFNTKTSNPGRKSKAQCQHQGSKSYFVLLYTFLICCAFGKISFTAAISLCSSLDSVSSPPLMVLTPPKQPPPPPVFQPPDGGYGWIVCFACFWLNLFQGIRLASTFASCKLLHIPICYHLFYDKDKIRSYQLTIINQFCE